MGNYDNNILVNRKNFIIWQNNLHIRLAAAKLKKLLRSEDCIPPIRKSQQESTSETE